MTTSKAPAKKAVPAKKAAPKLGNPDEAAAHAIKKPDPQAAYQQLALEWALRRAFDGPAWPQARRQVLKAQPMSEEVRQVLLERVDLMG
jgi:hypothetical protein